MTFLETFLREAFPHVEEGLVSAVVAEIGPKGDEVVMKALAELADMRETCDLLKTENAQLNDEISRHKDGIALATKAGLDVLGERARQRRMEGYDDAHDDGHSDFSLSSAAIAYILDAKLRGTTGHGFDSFPPTEWPWMKMDWKPKGIRQSLVVAAALLLAEIERLDRRPA